MLGEESIGFLSISDCRGFGRTAALCDMLRKSSAMTRTSATCGSNWLNVWWTSVVLLLLRLQMMHPHLPHIWDVALSSCLEAMYLLFFILSLHCRETFYINPEFVNIVSIVVSRHIVSAISMYQHVSVVSSCLLVRCHFQYISMQHTAACRCMQDVVLKAVLNHPFALQFASERLRGDFEPF